MKKKFIFLSLFIALFSIQTSYANSGQDISSLFTREATVFRGDQTLQQGVLLNLDKQFLNRLNQLKFDQISMELPVSGEEVLKLHLTRRDILTKDFILRTSENDTIQYNPGIYYIGHIEGYKGFCSISLFQDHVVGIITIADQGSYNLVSIPEGNPDSYIVYNDRNVMLERNFVCHVSDEGLEELHESDFEYTSERSGECVKVYIEGDYALNQNKGGVVPATNYITSLFTQVIAIYDAEDIPVEISEIMVWASQDPYNTNDSGIALDQFQDNNQNFNGDLAHLFALGGNGTGGLAYVDVLCGWSPYAYSNITGNFNNYPSYSWSVEVVAHEMGHNMGSRHTHACVWNNNNTQIDDCGNVYSFENGYPIEGNACFNSNNPIMPSSGTVMSYCHLIPGVGINLGLGFGTQPGNLIRNRYNSANCLTPCTGGGVNPPVAEFSSDLTDICEGDYIQFFDLSSNNPSSWNWTFEGGDPEESGQKDPLVLYEFGGSFDVTLIAANAGGEDEIFLPDFITVHNAPQALFTYEIVNGNQVIFTNTSSDAIFFFWDFGDGMVSSAQNPTHIYTFDGQFDVILSAGNEYCSDDFYMITIQIATMPTASMNIPVSSGCAPFTVNFYDNSSTNVTSWNWIFEGGTPATSSIANPVVSYNTPGHYDVSLTVSNGVFQNTITLQDTIHVFLPPAAGFSSSISGFTADFTNTSTNSTTYSWSFGDGNVSSLKDPQHIYGASGTYLVRLISSSFCGSDTMETEIEISALPVAGFSVESTTVCINQSVQFFNNSNTAEVNWVFEGGTPGQSGQQNPVVLYNASGTFDVTVYATNALGTDTLVMNDYITVVQNPTGFISSTVEQYTVYFTQQMTDELSFFWNFGDGTTSNELNPVHTYANDGSYLVNLTVFGLCDTLVIPHLVIVANPPDANFNHSQNTGCVPLTIQYANLSSPNTNSILWTFEGGNPVTTQAQNPSVVYANPGTFSVLLEAYNAQGQDVDFRPGLVEAEGIPNAEFNYSANQYTVSFFYSGDPEHDVLWDFGDGSTSSQYNPAHTYDEQGEYTVTLTVSNQCGQSFKTEQVSVALLPTAAFSFNPGNGCAPLSVQYTNQSSGAYSQILWIFEGGTPGFSTDPDPQINYFTGGTYNTTLIAYSANGNDTLLMEDIVTVDDGPDPSFYFTISGTTVFFFNQTEGANSFVWNFGDGSLSSEKDPKHTYISNGTYTVTLYAGNNCGQQAKQVQITISTVDTDDFEISSLILYPNPNNGHFVLQSGAPINGDVEIRVVNFLGQIIELKNIRFFDGKDREEFHLERMAKGMYFMEIKNGDKYSRIKFIIQ